MQAIKVPILTSTDQIMLENCARSFVETRGVPNANLPFPYIAHFQHGVLQYLPLSRWDVMTGGRFLTIHELWLTHVAGKNDISDANFKYKSDDTPILVASEVLYFEWTGETWHEIREPIDMDFLEEINPTEDPLRAEFAKIAFEKLINDLGPAAWVAKRAWELADEMMEHK